jgi:hypothetical protein
MTLCPDCGGDHHPELAEAAAEVATAEVLAGGAEGVAEEEADAAVEVARIEGETAIELRKIDAKIEAGWQEERIVRMEGELAGMREVLDRLAAPPEPAADAESEPAVVEPEPAEPPAPEETPAPAPAPKKSKGWWG